MNEQLIKDLRACAAYAKRYGVEQYYFGNDGGPRCADGIAMSVTGYNGYSGGGEALWRWLRVISAIAPDAPARYSWAVWAWNDGLPLRSHKAAVIAKFERLADSIELHDASAKRLIQSLSQPIVSAEFEDEYDGERAIFELRLPDFEYAP